MSDRPLAYLITFRTYGTWLHGDDRGSMDRDHRTYGAPQLVPDVSRRNTAYSRLASPPVTLSPEQRRVVGDAIRGQCEHRDWSLHALNVRTEHVHVVVSADVPPEAVLNVFKAYSTRALRQSELWLRATSPWSRHGSTRYLWSEESVSRACVYVSELQDTPKAVSQ